VIDQGFDGVVLDGLESYRNFEGGLEALEATN
jgi:endo-alpha-1,4-polygalactosaminidase (GH114 family)